MDQRTRSKDPENRAEKPAGGGQGPPRDVEKRRQDGPPGPPPADARQTAEARRAEPSEDFAQRDIETVEESPEEHDRRRHDRGPGDRGASQPV
jgi:hypothetical protein